MNNMPERGGREFMIEKVSREELLKTVEYMTKNFPYRLAGSKCEADASVYVTTAPRLRSDCRKQEVLHV